MQPLPPSVITTAPDPFARMARAAASHSSIVSVGMPVSSAVSVSLGQTTSHSGYSSSGSGSVGAGAELKTVVRPAARPALSAASVAGTGTSSWVSRTREAAKAGAAASMSAAQSSPFAPGTMRIWFWPLAATVICATPLAAAPVVVTCEVSTPRE